jgi:polar amino acid transport system substrate-binding protein
MAKWVALLCLGVLALPVAARDYIVSIPEENPLENFARSDLGEAYRSLGLHMVLRPAPGARSIDDANQGVVDAEAGRMAGISRQFSNLIQVPEPLISFDYQAISVGAPISGDGWNSLKTHRVCITIGDKLSEARTSGLQRETARSIEGAIRMLRAGRCDVMVINQFIWLEIDRLHLGPFCLGSSTLETIELYHYVNRRHADLVPKLAAILTKMRQDGTTAGFLAPVLGQLEAAKARNSCGAAAAEFTDAAHR